MSSSIYNKPFYHFTADAYLESIKANGITKGDVPYSKEGGDNAPWLTTDGAWQHQLWTQGSDPKGGVRLTVCVPEGDPNLERWLDYADRKQMDREWLRKLNKTGGGGEGDWWLYQGIIPCSWIIAVTYRPPYIRPKKGSPIILTAQQESRRQLRIEEGMRVIKKLGLNDQAA